MQACIHPKYESGQRSPETGNRKDDTYVNNHLLALLTHDNTRSTPREIIHLPERVQRQEKREERNGQDVKHYPADHISLPTEQEEQGPQTVNRRQHVTT